MLRSELRELGVKNVTQIGLNRSKPSDQIITQIQDAEKLTILA